MSVEPALKCDKCGAYLPDYYVELVIEAEDRQGQPKSWEAALCTGCAAQVQSVVHFLQRVVTWEFSYKVTEGVSSNQMTDQYEVVYRGGAR